MLPELMLPLLMFPELMLPLLMLPLELAIVPELLPEEGESAAVQATMANVNRTVRFIHEV
jgi:hypothetical protein